jgi:hypothetical protein
VLGPARRAPDITVSVVPGSRRRQNGDGAERRRRSERHPDRAGDGQGPGSRGRGRSERAGGGGARGTAARRTANGGGRAERSERAERDGLAGARPGAARERRPVISTAHRNAALAALGPQELPVAEELLRGGLPAVRQAIEEQNARAQREGRPTVSPDGLLATAERLAPVVNLATWKDRASTAQAAGRDARLRELRAVVAASRTVTLDEEGRAMAHALQASLDQRVTALRHDWLDRVSRAIAKGRVADALETAARPPEPATRLPAETAMELARAAGAALSPDLAPQEWIELLDAVTTSPVRRTVKPAGIPDDQAARAAALHAAGMVPDLARQLGLPVPPPPPRRGTIRERVGARPGRPRAAGGSAGAS